MTDIKEGDFVEWAYSSDVYKVLSTSGEMASIGRKLGDIQKVYSVKRTELHLLDKRQAQVVLGLNELMAKEKREYEERVRSLRRQWQDMWDLIHKSREESQ
jgi:hypothetical protein